MAKYEKTDLEPIYCALGEFVVSFQSVSKQIRFCYLNLMKRCGLERNGPADILLYSKEIPDNVINDAFKAAYCDVFNDEETRREVKAIYKLFKDLIESRNKIIHGYWVIGEHVHVFSEQLPDVHGHRPVRRGSGVEYDPLPTVAEIKELSQKAWKLRDALVTLPFVAGRPDEIRKLRDAGAGRHVSP